MDLFCDPSHKQGEMLHLADAQLQFFPAVDLGRPEGQLFDRLRDELLWREEDIVLFGKRCRQPRLMAWYGDDGVCYRYSGRRFDTLPWTASLEDLRERVEALSGERFNSVLANLYRNHEDSMGLHADDEPELGPEPVIASLSLGESRLFRLRHRYRRDLKACRLELTGGSLLVMRGQTQRFWKHEVPKSRTPCGPRINLTFRRVNSR